MTSSLPLFPLNIVLVPGLVAPLHIFEPRYRLMVNELLAIDDEDSREFAMVAVRDGRSFETHGIDAFYPVGTSTVIRAADELEDGRFDIVTTGSRRFHLLSVDSSRPLLRAEVEFIEEADEGAAELAPAIAHDFRMYRSVLAGRLQDEVSVLDETPRDATVLSFLITAAMVLPMDQRQWLLGAPDTAERLRRARSLLRTETALIEMLSTVPAIDPHLHTPSMN